MTLPITTVTQAMRESMDIYTLRQVSINLNGTIVRAELIYCSWSTMSYSVIGRDALGKEINESFWTQDEAEQEYIMRASYVMGAFKAFAVLQEQELKDLQAKLNGERTPA